MSVTTPAPAGNQVLHVTGQILKWTGLSLLWTVQYSVGVWVILAWRLMLASVKVGVVGVLLFFFLPVVGWVILALWLMLRHPAPAGPKKRSVWKPWGIK